MACLSALTFSFSLPSALLGSLNKDALMPAFRNPVRSMFFNVLPGYMQGRARAMSIALVTAAGVDDSAVSCCYCCSAWIIPPGYLVPGVSSPPACTCFSCRLMNKAYVSTLLATLKERLFLPDKADVWRPAGMW